MSINGFPFLLFLAGLLLLYYLVPKRAQWCVLLAGSFGFYLFSGLGAAAYLVLTIVLTYLASRGLEKLQQQMKLQMSQCDDRQARGTVKKRFTHRKRLLLGSVIVCALAGLFLFKYLNSFLSGVNQLLQQFHLQFSFRPLRLMLPLGISFYVFQITGYLIDVYRGKTEAEHNIFKYALFVSYFPQIIQGPINRFSELQSQLLAQRSFDAENIRSGVLLMIWGMLKKVFIADLLAPGVNEIYTNFTSYSGAISLLGAVLYCIQLYCDFSGGVDVMRGVSQMFGIEMAENFRRPYFADTLDEFWRRWHISLGEWMKDYLFYPIALSKRMTKFGKWSRRHLGQSVGKVAVPCVATLIVFLAVGVWQGPGFSNIAYGLWNGCLMSGAMLLAGPFRKLRTRLHIREDSRGFRVFRILRTALLVVIGRYFSHATSFISALRMLWRTVAYFAEDLHWSSFVSFGISKEMYLVLAVGLCVLFIVSLLQERGHSIRRELSQKPGFVQFLVLFVSILLLVTFVYLNGEYTAIAFVYENI